MGSLPLEQDLYFSEQDLDCHPKPGGNEIVQAGPENPTVPRVKVMKGCMAGKSSLQTGTTRNIQEELSVTAISTQNPHPMS